MTSFLPDPISRLNSFTSWSTENPTLPQPGVWLDNEFEQTSNFSQQVATAFRRVLQADGRLIDAIVDVWNLTPTLRLMLGGNWNARGDWATATVYKRHDVVRYQNATWFAMGDHTSTVFATDLAAGAWAPLSVSEALSVSIAAIDGLAATNVQAALEEIFAAVESFILTPVATIPEYVQQGVYHYGGTATGTASAIAIAMTPTATTLVEGMTIWFKAAFASVSGGTTIAVDALAPVNLKAQSGVNIVAGSWDIGDLVYIAYKNGNFVHIACTKPNFGIRRSESGLIVPTAKGAGSFTHNLATVIRFGALIECISARFGWSVGQRFAAPTYEADASNQFGIHVWESGTTAIGYQMRRNGVVTVVRTAESTAQQGDAIGIPQVFNGTQTALAFNIRLWAEGY